MKTATFSGNYTSLEKISEFVIQAAQDAGLNEQGVYEVELAVDEACCNIIDHAYGGEDQGDMQCTVRVREGELTVMLQDHGRPFNPDKVPKPIFNVPLQKLKRRGVGFYLMHKMVDELHYEPSPDRGNLLTLVKRKQ
jgi:anti-sigma regulatory factor (Ser/Thr protein kinase)